jgi:prepilin-type N-terminal cleavage/methylation domain-containing protein
MKNKKGYTLMEILLVVVIFSLLGVIVTQVVASTLRGSGKSENTVVVRENVSYAIGVMERNIRNAEEIQTCTGSRLDYINVDVEEVFYECQLDGVINRIFSSELNGYLTNDEISIDNCSGVFNCPPGNPINYVDIKITAVDAQSAGSENALTAQHNESIRVRLRNY